MKQIKKWLSKIFDGFHGAAPVGAAAIVLLALSSCAFSDVLRRCDGVLVDADKMECPDQVQGQYRMCHKNPNMYSGCVVPQ